MVSKVQPLGLEADASLGFKDRLKIPFASPADYPELGGVADGTTDSTAAWQAAADTGLTVWGPPGRWYVTDQVLLQNGQVLQGAGRMSCVFVVDAAFNMSASGVIRPGTGEPGAQVYDVGFEFEQPDFEGMTRADLIQYPPAIDATNLPRHVIDRVRVTLGWDGIDAQGNVGGCYHGFIEGGCFNKTLQYDGAIDFVSLDRLHHWPFDATDPDTPLGGLLVDGNAIALECGLVESAVFGVVQSYRGKVNILSTAGATITQQSILSLSLDGDGSDMTIAGGRWYIGTVYATRTDAPTTSAITATAGQTTIGNGTLIGEPSADLVTVNGADARVDFEGGSFRHLNPAYSAVRVVNGGASVHGVYLDPPQAARTEGFLISETGARLDVRGCVFEPRTTGTGPGVEFGNPADWHDGANDMGGWGVVTPPGGLTVVPSADPFAFPDTGNVVAIGAGTFGSAFVTRAGDVRHMYFPSGGTVANGGSFKLDGNADFVTGNGGTLTVLCTGADFIELSRSER